MATIGSAYRVARALAWMVVRLREGRVIAHIQRFLAAHLTDDMRSGRIRSALITGSVPTLPCFDLRTRFQRRRSLRLVTRRRPRWGGRDRPAEKAEDVEERRLPLRSPDTMS